MFALAGLILVIVVDYFKPQEFVPALAGVPLLYGLTALTLFGFLLDLRLGLSRFVPAPHAVLAVLFLAWAVATNVTNGMGVLVTEGFDLLIPVVLFLLVGHAVQSLRAVQVVAAVLLATGLALAGLGVHQGFADWECHRIGYVHGRSEMAADGRPCDPSDRTYCARGDAEPGYEYACERPGLFGTQTIAGRVRYRGTLQDPNELALAVAIVLPLAFAFVERRRTASRVALTVFALALVGTCVVLTQSRGGQIVFLLAVAVYFVNRFRIGLLGPALAAALALPIVLLGGRSTDEAAGSTAERVQCWAAALTMFRRSPVLGVGLDRFLEHHHLTAHNSFLLTAAELGFLGMVLWSAVLWVSLKIPVLVLRAPAAGEVARSPAATTWARALLASIVAMVGGMMFLSHAYKDVLWIFLGLSAALYQAVRRHDPAFRVRFGTLDVAAVVGGAAALLLAVTVLVRVRLG